MSNPVKMTGKEYRELCGLGLQEEDVPVVLVDGHAFDGDLNEVEDAAMIEFPQGGTVALNFSEKVVDLHRWVEAARAIKSCDQEILVDLVQQQSVSGAAVDLAALFESSRVHAQERFLRHPPTESSVDQVAHRVAAGEKMALIATDLGVGLARIMKMSAEAVKRIPGGFVADGLDGLSVRTKNALMSAGIRSISQAASAVSNGSIKEVQNLGDVCQEEVMRWILQSAYQAGTDPDAD